jgi:predicted transcriptional regulator
MARQRKTPLDSPSLDKPLPESELRILISLMRFGPSSATSLAGYLANMLPTTVYTLLQRLEAKGLVESEAGLRTVSGEPFTLKPSRVWTLRHDRLDDILHVELDHLLNVRYCRDPLFIDRLYTRLVQVKKEVAALGESRLSSTKRGRGSSSRR